jgi:hypothetical protein
MTNPQKNMVEYAVEAQLARSPPRRFVIRLVARPGVNSEQVTLAIRSLLKFCGRSLQLRAVQVVEEKEGVQR